MKIVVLPGDGIGPEITGATTGVLEAAAKAFDLPIELRHDVVGYDSLARHGTTVRDELLEIVRGSDGLILGPVSTFEFKDEARGEINPSMFFRKRLDLFANIRPCRTYDGIPPKLAPFDLVVVRENTEGFYADRNMEAGSGEILVTPDVSISIRRITRRACERIAREAFRLAMRRRRRVAVIHKANVLKVTDGMFLEVCREVASGFPEVEIEDILVDAMMAHVVRDPARFDVIVTTNMFGDILSDLTAELSGSLGLGSSLNAGADFAMAQAAHGSAPDIAGRNLANPCSLILSTAQLLSWHAERSGDQRFAAAADAIRDAVAGAIAAGESTRDLGGRLGTGEVGQAVSHRIGERLAVGEPSRTASSRS